MKLTKMKDLSWLTAFSFLSLMSCQKDDTGYSSDGIVESNAIAIAAISGDQLVTGKSAAAPTDSIYVVYSCEKVRAATVSQLQPYLLLWTTTWQRIIPVIAFKPLM